MKPRVLQLLNALAAEERMAERVSHSDPKNAEFYGGRAAGLRIAYFLVQDFFDPEEEE